MKNILIVISVIGFILINNYLGQTLPQFSVYITAILIGLIFGLLFFLTDYSLTLKFALMLGMLILIDVLWKNIISSDRIESVFDIVVLESIGIGISIIEAFIYGLIMKDNMIKKHIFLILLFCIIFIIYQSYFYSLGRSWINLPTTNIKIAKQKGLYISDVNFSDKQIICDNDTIQISYGWFEQQTETSHKRFLKKTNNTDNLYCTIIFDKKNGDHTLNNSLFLSDASNPTFISHIQPMITLLIYKPNNSCRIEFFKRMNYKPNNSGEIELLDKKNFKRIKVIDLKKNGH